MIGVDIAGVRKSYGAHEILHGIDIAIEEGSFVVLVGPSGCGKSTLLRMVAGLEITTGTIAIAGRIVNEVPPRDRDVAMVFQNYALYPHMTVRDNMAFSLRMRRAGKAETEAAVLRAATVLGLEALLDRYPRQLSGGQRQRVAMGRAIVRSPKVFLFDEPLSNLDAQLRVSMRIEIRALHQRLGTTSIYVTHDQLEAMTMADRIVVLREGVVQQVGAPLEVYDRPANRFVAGFIGSPAMNFLPGRLRRTGAAPHVEAEGLRLPLAREGAGGEGAGEEGREVVYGIRPEHLHIGMNGEPAIPAEVQVVEPTGANTFIFGAAAGLPICATFADRTALRPGERIALAPQLDRVHLFDAASGARL